MILISLTQLVGLERKRLSRYRLLVFSFKSNLLNPRGFENGPPKRLRHKIVTTGSLERKFHMYNPEVARNSKMLSLIG